MAKRMSAEAFRTLFEASPGANLVLDPALEIVAVSDAYLSATMTQRDQILGRRLFDVFPDNPDDPAATGMTHLKASLDRVRMNHVADVMADQKYDIRQPSGQFEIRYWSPTNSPVLDDNGELQFIIHHVDDITARIAMQATLSRRQAELEDRQQLIDAVFQASPDGIKVVNPDLIITESSRAVGEILGAAAETLRGRDSLDAVHANDRDAFSKAARGLFDDNDRVMHIRYQALHANGHSVPIEARGRVIRDGEGRPICAVIIERDITENVANEATMAANLATIQGILDSAVDTIAILDPELRIVSVNKEVATLTGHGVEEVHGAHAFADVHPDDKPIVINTFSRLFGPDSIADLRYRVRHTDGRWVTVRARARALRDANGTPTHVVLIARDVSDSVTYENALQSAKTEAERANAAKSEFLSRMSHELRTPLNSILGFAQVLQLEETLPEQPESLDFIYRAGRHLLDLINEVLDISRIEAGTMTVSLESVSFDELTHECLALVAPQAKAQGVRLVDNNHCGTYVHTDKQRAKQVLLNLLSNAIKFNKENGTVTIWCEERSGWLRISVGDTGPGVAPERIEALFVPFDRLDAEERGVEGTGLGLALSKRLVEVMGGELGVESTVGEGSTFWIELPITTVPELAELEATTSTFPDVLNGQTKTLLYIEDNLANLRLVERLLSHRIGIQLITAIKGTLGFELAQQHHPDLILMDVHLPDVSGLVLVERLRADPRTANVPIVMLSADATAGQIRRLLQAGANDYLTKPLEVSDFHSVINTYLKGKSDADDSSSLE